MKYLRFVSFILILSIIPLLNAADGPLKIGIVAKIGGIPWFNNVEIGIERAGERLGVDAWMVGPTSDDPALQVRAIEDLIAQKVDVIGVIPNNGEALEPVLKRAKEAGIIVITHESPGQKFSDWNVDLIESKNFGEAHMKSFAESMGEEGEFAIYVGGLSVQLHNDWADAALAYAAENYPNLKLVGDRYGVSESIDDSYNTTLDLMRANPKLKGFLVFGAQGPIGVARAVERRGKKGITIVGPIIPSHGAKYIYKGIIHEGFIWNPQLAGEAMVMLGKALVEGVEPQTGMEFPGIGTATVDEEKRDIVLNKLQPINKDTIDALLDMGL